MNEADAILIVAGAVVTALGWFAGSEIKRLRSQIDELQSEMKELLIKVVELQTLLKK